MYSIVYSIELPAALNSEATLLNIRDYVQKKEMDRNWPEQRKFSEMELAKICDNCFIC